MTTRFDALVEEFQHVTPFRIRYKEEAWEMYLLHVLIGWFCPNFLTHFTTVIGTTIYFPNRHFIRENEEVAMRILAHEVVHLLDSERCSEPVFMLSYLFPQILAVGVFCLPLIGPWALLFLLFLLPLPAPFRFYFESRAFALDLMLSEPAHRARMRDRIVEHFAGWSYYRMFPFPTRAEQALRHWMEKAEKGEDKILVKVLLIYEMMEEQA